MARFPGGEMTGYPVYLPLADMPLETARRPGRKCTGHERSRSWYLVSIQLPYWYLISRVFNFAFFAIVKKSRN